MEVLFDDAKFEKLCTDEREMRKKREDVAGKLKLRMNALRTAVSVGELPTHDPLGKWHSLTGDLEGLWAGKLSANFRLLMRPENAEDPKAAVTVTVIKIDDYH
ncbi:plasmid maintenance system killer protein [Arthrobacter sp. MWB30]|nr:plasmid maintenance system killer protein [Arthrobacter sp. MWB30]